MATKEHLDELGKGITAWNTWRESRGPESQTPDLSEADLSGTNLENANLSSVNLSGANLERANLKKANLEKADLKNTKLKQAKLTQAILTEAILDDASLEGADLERAQAGTARWRRARLDGAKLTETYLSGSDLREATGVRLDSTFDRNVTFSPWATDPWSKLRRGYTGPRFALTLLLVALALVPYGAKAFVWVGVNYAQSLMQAPVMRLQDFVGELATADDPRAEVLRETVTTLASVARCLGTECKEFQIWEVVLGLDQPGFYWLLTAALILYNIGRGVLTVAVGVLRDEEERSGQSPSYGGASGYRWLAALDRVVFLFLFVAAGSLLVHVVDWLTRSVFIPV